MHGIGINYVVDGMLGGSGQWRERRVERDREERWAGERSQLDERLCDFGHQVLSLDSKTALES